jgi:hypothetical protein
LEINPEESSFTYSISDVFIALPAGRAMKRIEALMSTEAS